MMGSFFTAGGMGMYPTLAFGLLQLGAGVFYALEPERRSAWLFGILGAVTLSSGLLGLTLGLVTTTAFVAQLPEGAQGATRLTGYSESAHNLALPLALIVFSTLVVAAGSLRRAIHPPPRSTRE